MNMHKYQKSRSQMTVEAAVRFEDFVCGTLDDFQYDNLLFPKNLLLLLGMNEVNGFKKNGKFEHFTKRDNFLQFHTAVKMGDPETVYIEVVSNGKLLPLESIVDEVQKGTLYLSDYDIGQDLYFGKICSISVIKDVSFDIKDEKGTHCKVVYTTETCTVSRMTNYFDNQSYYSDQDLAKLYRAFSGEQVEELTQDVIDELQRELSAMCDFITQ